MTTVIFALCHKHQSGPCLGSDIHLLITNICPCAFVCVVGVTQSFVKSNVSIHASLSLPVCLIVCGCFPVGPVSFKAWHFLVTAHSQECISKMSHSFNFNESGRKCYRTLWTSWTLAFLEFHSTVVCWEISSLLLIMGVVKHVFVISAMLNFY